MLITDGRYFTESRQSSTFALASVLFQKKIKFIPQCFSLLFHAPFSRKILGIPYPNPGACYTTHLSQGKLFDNPYPNSPQPAIPCPILKGKWFVCPYPNGHSPTTPRSRGLMVVMPLSKRPQSAIPCTVLRFHVHSSASFCLRAVKNRLTRSHGIIWAVWRPRPEPGD